MNKYLRNIFAVSQCPSEEKLIDYASGKLNPAEQRMVESHLSGCEMCSDYTDGLLLLKKPEEILQKTVEINAEINILIAPKKRNLYNRLGLIAGIAAILTVLIIVTFILQKQFKNDTIQQVAQNKSEAPSNAAETMPLEEITEPVTAAEKSSLTRESSQSKMPVTLNPDDNEQGFRYNEFAPGITKDSRQVVTDKTEIAADFDTEDVIFSEQPVAVSDEKADQLSEMQLREENNKKSETVTLSQTTVAGGAQHKESSGKTAGNAEQEADSGIVLFDAGEYRSALTYFEQKLKETPTDQKAQWYFTLSLIRLGRTEEARVMLRSIIDAKGEYQKQAEKELKKLK